MFDERFRAAAQRVLGGAESVRAAQALEGALLDDYPGDERFDDLLEALALYAPGERAPYTRAQAIRMSIEKRWCAPRASRRPQTERPRMPR